MTIPTNAASLDATQLAALGNELLELATKFPEPRAEFLKRKRSPQPLVSLPANVASLDAAALSKLGEELLEQANKLEARQ